MFSLGDVFDWIEDVVDSFKCCGCIEFRISMVLIFVI